MDLAALDDLEREFLDSIAAADDEPTLEDVRLQVLGRKGRVPALMKQLGAMEEEARIEAASRLNALKTLLGDAINTRRTALHNAALEERLTKEALDTSLPVDFGALGEGRVHPVSQVSEEIVAIFADMGFNVEEGPEVETDYYNFTALNISASHPARDMHDTFYLSGEDDSNRRLLRTHTSPVQVRAMEAGEPPFRFIAPGRVYRRDSDQTHTPMFHQVEGLVIDKGIHMGHLKWTLESFLQAFFETEDVHLRFRPSYFPFTEPSIEVDVRCQRRGDELHIGIGDDWMEILGCGMVHPAVLENCAANAAQPWSDGEGIGDWQGFAFGMGIDRLAMLKYGIPDLRTFFDADWRWLKHYGFLPLDMPDLAGGLSS